MEPAGRVNTHIAAAGALTWMIVAWNQTHKPSGGAESGAIHGMSGAWGCRALGLDEAEHGEVADLTFAGK